MCRHSLNKKILFEPNSLQMHCKAISMGNLTAIISNLLNTNILPPPYISRYICILLV